MARYSNKACLYADGRTDGHAINVENSFKKTTFNSKYRKYINDFYSVLFLLIAMEKKLFVSKLYNIW